MLRVTINRLRSAYSHFLEPGGTRLRHQRDHAHEPDSLNAARQPRRFGYTRLQADHESVQVREARRQRVRNLHADSHLHRATQLVGRGSLIREKIEKQGRRLDVPLTRAAILKEVINRFEMRNSRLLDTPRNSRTALQSPVFRLTDR